MLNLAGDHDFVKVAHLIGVSRLANITGLDLVGVPVVSAIRPGARSLCVSQGKGLDIRSAALSAVMEAAELFHAERLSAPARIFPISQPDGPIIKLRQTKKIPDNQPMSWLTGTEILEGAPIFVPFDAVDMNQDSSRSPAGTSFAATGTGLAAGFSREFALRHALLEVIERDAHSLWRAAPTDFKLKRLINPKTIDDEACAGLIEKFRLAGYSPCFWDATTELGIPCCIAEFFAEVDGGGFFWPYSIGVGCDLSPPRALGKAILEAAQIRLTYIAGARDDLLWQDYSETYERIALNRRNLRNAALPAKDLKFESSEQFTIDQSVKHLCKAISGSGFDQVALVDLSHGGTGVHVLKVLIPGMEDSVEATDEGLSSLGVARLETMVKTP